MARTRQDALGSPDRRQFGRSTPRYLRTYSPEPATIIDLSRQGMCLEVTARMIPGSMYAFRVRHRGCIVHLTGQMRWQGIRSVLAVPDGNTLEIYRAGIAFDDDLSQQMLDFFLCLPRSSAGS